MLKLLASSLLVAALALAGPASSQAPKVGKPRPAPAGPIALPPLPPAAIDNSLEIEGEDIKAREERTRLTVETRINGRGPYQFLVDSGADTSVVGLRIARDLALPLGSPAVLNGTTARSLVDRVKVRELQLGSNVFRDLELPALSEAALGGSGLIGIDALHNQRLLMDFEKKLIRVEDARTAPRVVNGEIVVVARRRRGQLILTQVRSRGISLEAVIDTGSEITIGNEALRQKLIRKHDKFETVKMTGVTGETVEVQIAFVPELQIGSVLLENVPVAFADVPPFKAFRLDGGPALLLGTDLLSTFRRVSLDFRSRKVRFQLRRCEQGGILIRTAPSAESSRLRSLAPETC